MKRVLTAVVLVPLVIAAVLWLPPWIFSLVVGIVALVATDEFLRIAEANGIRPARWVAMVGVALVFLAFELRIRDAAFGPTFVRVCGGLFFATWQHPHAVLGLILLFTFLAFAICMRRAELNTALAGTATSTLAIVYLGLTLSSLAWIKDLRYGPFLLIYLFIVVWSGDVFAFYVGRALGRHPLAPTISPKKTWEGAVASFVASVVLGTLFFRGAPTVTLWLVQMHSIAQPSGAPIAIWRILGLSAVLNVAAQFGDLFESMIKRGGNVKDSGTVLPGHGGVLDRIDALLFAAPALWYYALFTNI
jgi:phosphatidate cytidylyltransferase